MDFGFQTRKEVCLTIFNRLLAKIHLLVKIAFCFLAFSTFFLEAKPSSIKPFLMPDNHPIKQKLDVLFSPRKLLHSENLEKMGFVNAKPKKFTQLVVTTHPHFPGYIFKLYLDTQRFHKDQKEHNFWVLRCRGAQKIREEIRKETLGKFFKVPQKWIYLLPKSEDFDGYYTKTTILVEEDMNLVSNSENINLWKSDFVPQELLSGLFFLLKTVGLHDCTKPDNIPFSRDGKVAFVDTQTFNKNVFFDELIPHLSNKNKKIWKQIIQQK